MRKQDIEEAAALFTANRLSAGAFSALPPDCRPKGEAEAYAIQAAQRPRLAALGAVVGYKIGCTTPVMQQFLNIAHPCAGEIYASTVLNGNAAVPHARFRRVGVECEIAVRLGRDLPARSSPYDRAAVADAVSACMAAIEIVDDRYDDFRGLDVWTLVADQFFNAGCVLGPEVKTFDPLRLDRMSGGMRIDGEAVGQGVGADVLGHPLEALAWLANLRAGLGEPLRGGDLVLLGSVVETKWPQMGQVVSVSLEGLGEVGVTFT